MRRRSTFASQSSFSSKAGTPRSDRFPEPPPDDQDGNSSILITIPLVVAVVPPLLSALTGNSHAWGDFLVFVLVIYYLQWLMRVPWDLYEASRSSHVPILTTPVASVQDPSAAAACEAAAQAAVELRRLELLHLFFALFSPIIGGLGLWLAKRYLFSPTGPIGGQLNIGLFVLASGIRSAVHIADLFKNRALHLQKEVHIPFPEIEQLQKRVYGLETELNRMRTLMDQVLGDTEGVREAVSSVEKLRGAVKKLKEERERGQEVTVDHDLLLSLERRIREQGTLLEEIRSGELVAMPRDENEVFGLVGSVVGLGTALVRRSVDVMLLPAKVTFGVAKSFALAVFRAAGRKPMIEGS